MCRVKRHIRKAIVRRVSHSKLLPQTLCIGPVSALFQAGNLRIARTLSSSVGACVDRW